MASLDGNLAAIQKQITFHDSQAAFHLIKAAKLRELQNSFLPVGRLLPEILVHIFEYCTGSSPDIREFVVERERCRYPYRWLAVTQVCHLWRDVALNTPRLWITIYLTPMKREVLHMLLARSNHLPLSIYSRDPTWLIPAHVVMEEFSEVIPRAQHLELELPSQTYAHFWWSPTFPKSLPQLLTLSLYCPRREQNFFSLPLFLKPERCTLPRLTKLVIADYTIDWGNLRLPETLKILNVSIYPSEKRATISTVISVVGKLPDLEELYLCGVIREPEARINVAVTSVTKTSPWPRLRTLQLQESPSRACIFFLNHLNIPGSAKVYLSFCDRLEVDVVPFLVSCLFPIVDAKAMVGEDDTIQAANWLEISAHFLHIYKRLLEPQLTSDSPDIDIHIKPWFSLHDLRILLHISKQLPLRDVEVLVIMDVSMAYMSDAAFAYDWRELLVLLNNVQEVNLVNYNEPIKSRALDVLCTEASVTDTCVDSTGTHRSKRFLLPKAGIITLRNVNFIEAYEHDDFQFVSEVERALAARKTLGSGVAEVELFVIATCRNMDATHVRQMKKFVRPVNWDRKIQYFDQGWETDPDDGSGTDE